MIDHNTGTVILGKKRFSPLLTREDFEKSSDFEESKKLSSIGSNVCYGINFEQGDLSLDFKEGKLFSIMIAFHLPNEDLQGGWGSWSQENERKRKQLHDQILQEELGSTSRKFSWGEVGSIADPKTCDSSIFIAYT